MAHSGTWSSYGGSGSIILAVVLLVVAGALAYIAMRLTHPIEVKRPGATIGVSIVVIWLLSVMTFLVAITTYVSVLFQQQSNYTAPADPITPVTMLSALLTFAAILFLAWQSGFWVAVGSAIVGTIAAPMIFELPFDLIVMWRTYPPTPQTQFTLLFFLPLFIVEISSFAMLMLSPLMRLSRSTLLLLAGMFFIFAIWALFGFAYPAAPVPITLNMVSKVVAFATAVSLFFPEGAIASMRSAARAPIQAPYRSGLT